MKERKESACGGMEKQNKTKLEETPKDLKFLAIPGVKILLSLAIIYHKGNQFPGPDKMQDSRKI